MEFIESQPESIFVKLYSGVENACDIVIPADVGAVVDLRHICSPFQLEAAIRKARQNISNGCMKAKSIQGELCYFLTSSKNINDSVSKLSPDANTTDIALVLLTQNSDDNLLYNRVKGKEEDYSLFETLLTPDKASRLMSAFKLTAEELQVSSLSDAIVMKIAIKDFS
jgi:tRNA threonylcarbamoyladenosine modification (KEOPS) complex Cgi121 subunit